MKMSRFLPASIIMAVLSPAAAQAQFVTAGSLYVDLRATNVTAGTSIWQNEASGFGPGANFTNAAAPSAFTVVSNVLGGPIPGVLFNGTSSYSGPATTADLDGAGDRTIEVWALNPAIGGEETMVSWGHRGGPNGTDLGFNFGNNGTFGAVTHWGGHDVSWPNGVVPSANQWHHLVYTYDGNLLVSLYADGVLLGTRTLPSALATFAGFPINLGAQHTATSPFLLPDYAQAYSGYINSVRVHGGVLSASGVMSNYVAGPVIPPTPVVLTDQPRDISVGEGGPASFTVKAIGTAISYRWFRDGSPIADGTSAIYTITNALSSDNGASFRCVLSNFVNGTSYTTTSQVARLTVLTLGQALSHRYSFTSDARDSVGGAHGTLQGAASISGGQVQLNGVAGNYVNLPPRLIDGLSAITIEFWASYGVNLNFARTFDFGNSNLTAGIRYMFFTHRAAATSPRQAIIDPLAEKNISATGSFDNTTNQHVAVVFDPQSGFMGFYTNGVLAASRTDLVTLTNVDNAVSYIGRSVFAADPHLNGSIDEFRIYSTRLSAVQIATNFLNGPNAAINGGPLAIMADIHSLTVAETDPVTFNFTVNGDGPIGYQWYRNNVAIPNATNSYFSIASANPNDSGAQFYVVASNFVVSTSTRSTVVSSAASLTVINAANSLAHRWTFDSDANDSIGTAHGVLTNSTAGGVLPKITNGAVVMNGSAQFVDLPNNLVDNYSSMTMETWVTDNGSGAWARIADFGNSLGAEGTAGTGNQYLFLTSPSGGGGLRAALTYAGGGGEQLLEIVPTPLTFGVRRHVVWTIDSAARISKIYVDGAQVAANVAFTQTPMGMGSTVNNWLGRSQYSPDAFFNGSIHDFRLYDSALSLPTIQRLFALGPDFRLVDGPAQILRQPVAAVANERQTVSFSAVTGGRNPIFLQWYRNGVLIPGATNLTLTFAAAAADNGASYQLWATNNVGGTSFTASSSAAGLTVIRDTNAPILIRAQNLGTNLVEILFSEPMAAVTATNPVNYALAGVAVTSVSISSDGTLVTLATGPLIFGNSYSLTVSNLTDSAGIPNRLAPNPTVISFTALPYAVREIGSPEVAGSIISAGNGYDFTASGVGAGSGTARTNDQFTFAYQNATGNFDVQVRLGALNLSEAWARAGLMARDGFTSNATFAATWATPSVAGAFFQARTGVNGATTLSGNFPVNYPNTWVRLRRVGDVFDGFASVDGQTWSFLGTATITMPATIQVGVAASANSSSGRLVTQVRDIGVGVGTIKTNLTLPFEPLAASSRKTALVFSEIMYNPPDAWGASNNLEWVEIFNTGVVPEDLTGHRLAGDISYDFPAGTILQPGQFLLVARNPSAFSAFYHGPSALGPWSGNLGNNGGTLRLVNELGGRLLEVEYDNESPWPVAADGTGSSLVLRKASYGENDPRAWSASTFMGGSPGQNDPAPLPPTVVINEFIQTTNGFVELKNVAAGPVDISGYILTDNPDTNRYVFPPGTSIAANGLISVNAAALGFSPDPTDGHLYILLPGRVAVVDAVEFGPFTGVARGRYPDGSPYWSEMSTSTPGAANSVPLQRDIIINEIMYHPISGSNNDEYIELYNRGTNAIGLNGWRIRGGIDFDFPSNATIAARGYVVVAENLTNLLAHYTNLTTANTFGNYSGSLANGGERIALQMPVTIVVRTTNGFSTNRTAATINEVTYRDGGRWGQWSDGGGSSLELIDPRASNRLAANWADSDESSKAPWTTIDMTTALLNGQTDQSGNIIGNGAPNRFEFFLQDSGEVLVDDVEMRNNGGVNLVANPSFENGLTGFNFNGTHRRSFVQTGGAITGSNVLHIVSTGRGDAGPNKAWAAITQLTVNSPLITGTPAATNSGTIRAQVRWLKGSPYVMFRTRGHWMEATLRLNLPVNLGTPGAANSRLVANAGPSISETTHTPVLPAAGQPVVVSARVADPDDLTSVILRYRLDPAITYTNVTMVDDGTGGDVRAGDGIYSGTIPGFAANALVAFYITATDAAPITASTTFPNGIPLQECLVRFGDPQISGSLGIYRTWMTASNVTTWTTIGTAAGQRERNANDPIDCTFVYGNWRVVYDAGTLYSGSPWHTLNAPYNGPAASPPPDYELNFPPDDKFLGAEAFVLSAFDVTVANNNTFFADRAVQNEATGNWIGRKLGQQYNHRRHVHVVFNGARRGTIYEDAQQPNGDMLEEYFPNDNGGELRKIEDWFEFDNAGSAFTVNTRSDLGSQSASMLRLNDNTGAVDSKRYRWTFRPRATDAPNDWFNLTNLIAAVNTPGTGQDYVNNVLAWVDMRNFMRPIATHHIAGDWDSFGYERGKNMFAYKPDGGSWRLLLWDIELGLGHLLSRPATDGIYRVPHDPMIAKMFTTPQFQREYLSALLDGVNGPLAPGAADVLMDARYASFIQNNLPVIAPDYIKSFIAARREYLLTQIPSTAFSIDGPRTIQTTNPVVTLTGAAPVTVSDIVVDGRSLLPVWSTVTNWSGSFRVPQGTNIVVVRALDGNGIEITNIVMVVILNSAVSWPAVRINEWMAANTGFIRDPADNDADDWFELYNPTAQAVDLGGWYLSDTLTNKTQYLIPSGFNIPARGYLLVWADGEPEQNPANRAQLHVNFQLRQAGEEIVLTAPDGTVIDRVIFGDQTNDVSQGRSPDGSATIAFQSVPTPGGSNSSTLPLPFLTNARVSNGLLSFTFTTVAGHHYRVEYKNNLTDPAWTQAGSDQTATGSGLTFNETVGTNPRRFYRVRMLD